MATTDFLREWWLFKKLDERHTLFFPDITVEIKEDELGLFGATVRGFDDRIIATDEDPTVAEHEALMLFFDLADYGVDTGRLDQFLAGTGVKGRTLELAFHDVEEWANDTLTVINSIKRDREPLPSTEKHRTWAKTPPVTLEPRHLETAIP